MHIPVLTKEILKYLEVKPNENFIDATVGESGHTLEILKKNGPKGCVLAIDLDPKQVENSRLHTAHFKERVMLVNDSYINIKDIIRRENFKLVDGILLDLGMSSWQLEESKRGFSFKRNEVLDMRYSMENVLTAEKIVNEYPEYEIEKILRDYGEEKFAGKIARKISEIRKTKRIQSTFELKEAIQDALPPKFRSGKIHVATRTFQALRIAVNGELDNLKEFLPQAIEVLSSGGRLAIISFHSLEDRMVKNFFKNKLQQGLVKILTKKPITASYAEVLKNPRSRSAKLRAIIKINPKS